MVGTTNNERSVIDQATFSVRRSIHIAAPIEKVWISVTEPEHISRWFGHPVLDANGVGTITWPGRDSIPIRVEAIDEPRMVSYRWCNDDALGSVPAAMDDEHSTVFTFTLESVANGTRLTVVETGFETTSDPVKNLEEHRTGWNGELDKLVVLLESAS
jgi:uncharacterized protein YndB with AHSA1/START domain